MNTKQFDRISLKILAPILCEGFGYRFDKGVFYLETDSKLRRIIILDYNSSSKRTFRVMIGVNSVVADDGYGLYYMKYFTGGSLSNSPKEIPCFSEEKANESLERLKSHLETMIFPFLDSVKNPFHLVELIENMGPQYKAYRQFYLSKVNG